MTTLKETNNLAALTTAAQVSAEFLIETYGSKQQAIQALDDESVIPWHRLNLSLAVLLSLNSGEIRSAVYELLRD